MKVDQIKTKINTKNNNNIIQEDDISITNEDSGFIRERNSFSGKK